MDYINAHFVTLGDLAGVDEQLAALAAEQKALNAQLGAACGSRSLQTPPKAAQLISALADNPNPTPQVVTQYASTYGELKVLAHLCRLVERKAALERETSVMEKAAALETLLAQIDSETATRDLVDILQQTAHFLERESVPGPVRTALEEAVQKHTQSRRAVLTEQLESGLANAQWLSLKEAARVDVSALAGLFQCCSELIDIQAATARPAYPETWWAVDTVVQPFSVRFSFHFRHDSKTNSVSKPEWAFSYVEEFLAENLADIERFLGPALARYGQIGAFEAITAVLRPVREKLAEMVHMITASIDLGDGAGATDEHGGRLLSHLIFEATSFDQRLRSVYKYNPNICDVSKAPEKRWMGLTGDVLVCGDSSDAVGKWLQLEQQLARQRFTSEILAASDAFAVDNTFRAGASPTPDAVQPSYSAYGLARLFENLTSHFQTLSIVKYQLQYVSRIQLVFLDEYLAALRAQLRQFAESGAHKIMLAFLPGGTLSEQVKSLQTATASGLRALETLTGLYCLAKYTVVKMGEWEQELVFVQLWDYYRRVTPKADAGRSLFAILTVEYNALIGQILERVDVFFRRQFRDSLRAYVNDVNWATDCAEEDASPLAGTVAMADTYLTYLQRVLPKSTCFVVAANACDALMLTLLEYVVRSNKFCASGAARFRADIAYLKLRLAGVLFLASAPLLNRGNRLLCQVCQSADLLDRFDAGTARVLRTLFCDSAGFRAQFDHGLAALSDDDIRDLLHRIV